MEYERGTRMRYIVNVAVKVPEQLVIDAPDPFEARDIARDLGFEVIEGAYEPKQMCDDLRDEGRKPYYFLREFTGGR